MSSIKTNADIVAREFKKNAQAVGPYLQAGMVHGIQDFGDNTIRTQMRGRPGLKVQSGHLINSWFVRQVGKGMNFVVKWATRTKYARIHQYGGVIKHVTAKKQVTIPKRLHILEQFKLTGPDTILRHMVRQINIMKQKTAGK